MVALQEEIRLQAGYLNDEPVETVYFGGGTPSLLTADEINQLMDVAQQHFTFGHLREVTLEANPDDLSTHYLKAIRNTPVNRFSIGIQSFHDADLAFMNRAHNSQQADYAIKAAQDAGFSNLTIDLIYGTPGLTDNAWKANLKRVADLSIAHFSAYALTVEENTALYYQVVRKKVPPVDAEQAAGQLEILMEEAAIMGFDHYEISNFGKPGFHAVHNTNYWKGIPYIGIGPSAHSFDGKNRRWNVANNALYTHSILAQNTIPFEEELLTEEQRFNEYIMTSLRTMWGCDLDYVATTWGDDTRKRMETEVIPYVERGQVVPERGKLILTQSGKLFADNIAAALFQV